MALYLLAVQLFHLIFCYYYPTTPLPSKKKKKKKLGQRGKTACANKIFIMVRLFVYMYLHTKVICLIRSQ